MIIYNFDDFGRYINTSEAAVDELETEQQGTKKYLLPRNATSVAPNVDYHPGLEEIRFDTESQSWLVHDIKIKGEYYLKTTGEKFEDITLKERNNYTTVTPNLTTNPGDKILFNEETSSWRYSCMVSETTFKKLKNELLPQIKAEANRRISCAYPDYKQRNLTAAVCFIHNKEILAFKTGQTYELTADEKATVAKAEACNDFILFIRNKSNALEMVLNDITTSAVLWNINITSDNYWL